MQVLSNLSKVVDKATKFHAETPSIDIKPGFTDKELTIIKLICKQYSNKEIALLLKSSVRYDESARERIQCKTETKNMVGVAIHAVKNNVINLVDD